ncbi:MAG: GNAT family N-acetyltransferase [Spirochaetes bacterium]|nr:GNAT family N-acetyltransferase [Spirochaetota bacterium]
MNAIIRPARKDESMRIAELDSIASGGVVDFLYEGLVPGKRPVEVLGEFLSSEKGHYNYTNAAVADIDGSVAGAAISYPSHYQGIDEAMRGFFPHDRLDHLQGFFESSVPHSLYIDALAVHEAFRKQGLAGMLIDGAADRARSLGLSSVSLIVLADNAPARALYAKKGFVHAGDVPLEYHEKLPHRGGAFLLKRPL